MPGLELELSFTLDRTVGLSVIINPYMGCCKMIVSAPKGVWHFLYIIRKRLGHIVYDPDEPKTWSPSVKLFHYVFGVAAISAFSLECGDRDLILFYRDK